MKKTTIVEIAERAGVGRATVDRVLNERGNVTPATAERVLRAARELGLKRTLPDAWQPLRHLEVVLCDNGASFFRRLEQGFVRAAEVLGKRQLVLHRTLVREPEPERLARLLEQAASRRDGIVLFGPAHPAVATAVNRAGQAGVPVVTLATVLPNTHPLCHVGIDQYAAGRTAGWLLGQLCREPGEVLVVCGRLELTAHRERVRGCLERLARSSPRLQPRVLEGREQNELIESLVRERLAAGEVAGLYNTGPGNGIIAGLLERRQLAGRCVFIGHELHPTTQALLRQGKMHLTLDQNPELHAFRALELLICHLERTTPPAGGGRIDFTLFTPENLGD
ncbi:transcriptional regulator [Zobellella taiwanensis]|uniref:Transcriptional regulator n=1 Tax=Zobellella taiwanensis TaxID=347535 RepID=A0A2P7RAE9_9GAMM|nr:LacI family DNA-binding transcriptional regulator [Zobellella taiwanensis]PSJ47206.1 transcriptional regulator [Zobellella taiwanensis]